MSLLPLLHSLDVLRGVVLPSAVTELLDDLEPLGLPPAGPPPTSGTLRTTTSTPLAFGASLETGATLGWRVETDAGEAVLRLTVAAGTTTAAVPGVSVATATSEGVGANTRTRIAATATPLRLTAGGTVAVRLSPAGASIVLEHLDLAMSAPAGAVPAVSLPGGYGLLLPSSFTVVDGAIDMVGAALVLPQAVPLLGGLPLPLDVADGAGGTTLTVQLTSPDPPPQITGALTFQLPERISLSDLVPTTADVALTLPDDAHPFGPAGPVLGGVRVRAVLSRPPGSPDDLTIAVSAESDRPDGLASGGGASPADIALGATFVLGPAIAASLDEAGPAAVAGLFAAAASIGDRLAAYGDYTLHAVTLEAAPADGSLLVSLDVSGGIVFEEMDLGVATIVMDDDRPLRVRWRGISARVDLARLAAGAAVPADALDIDFRPARCEVVDPGGWQVVGGVPRDLLQVVGTRSGSGSMWVEVDLRFAMDLGPVKISGATVRGTWSGGAPSFGIRGFEASLELPGVVIGGGGFQLDSAAGSDGVRISLWGTLVPLNVSGFLDFSLRKQNGVTQFAFAVGLDLPSAIPLGPTGLGLYSVAASFGANAAMEPLDPADPLGALRAWAPWKGLAVHADDVTIGAGVVIGTVPDGGLSFSALGVLGITVPDFALRIGVNAALFRSSRKKIADVRNGDVTKDEPGLTLLGGLSATSDAIDVGVEGRYLVPTVVDARLPVAAHFDFRDPSDWWLHAGSDGDLSVHKRPPGPLQARVVPGLGPLEAGGWAFLMIRGDGIPEVAGNKAISPAGFAVALGVGFSKTFGVEGVLWAKVSTSLVAAIGTKPVVVWADGRLVGEVGIGPFTLGVDARLRLQIGPAGRLAFHLRVCAVVDLWLTTLEGCIELGALDETPPPPVLPAEEDWPWPELTLADGLGRILPKKEDEKPPPRHVGADDADGPAVPADWLTVPTVWADAIPMLAFPVSPIPAAGLPGENSAGNGGITGAGRTRFRWRLTALSLQAVKSDGTPVGNVFPLTKAAWQPALGLPADAVGINAPRVLALLTRDRTLAAVHAADLTGMGDALRGMVGLCGVRFAAGRGWTYGIDARRDAAGSWHVARRADVLPLSPFGSLPRGVGFRITEPERDERWGQDGVDWPGGPVGYASVLTAGGESFLGAFRARSPRSVPWAHEGGETRYRVVLDEPADEGDLFLRAVPLGADAERGVQGLERWLLDHRTVAVEATGWVGQPDAVVVEPSPENPDEAVIRIALPRGKRVSAVSWTLPWATTVDVLGLHAVACADADAAAAAEADRQKAVTDDAAGAKGGALTPQRQLLTPGTVYRLSATLAWERLSDDGAGAQPGPDDQGPSRTATWFLRTAPIPQTTAVPAWKGPSGVFLAHGAVAVDAFRPEYLARYFDGYSVADHEAFVFTDDRPSARFHAPHIRSLAKAYRRDLGLMLKRTDRAQPSVWRMPGLVGIAARSFPRFPAVDAVAAAAAEFGCPLPPRAAAATWPTRLSPSTPYELSVALPRRGHKPDSTSPQLPGITFTTSAYANPQALMTSLGFTRSLRSTALAAATARGHLPVRPAVALPSGLVAGADELEAAITALGLPPLRVGAARSSLLWTPGDGGRWALHGLLLEADEPLVRRGGERMDVGEAMIGTASFTIRRRDDDGTRALWLLPSPLVPRKPHLLRLRVKDGSHAFWVRITVPAEPAFAGSAIVGRNRP